MDNYVWFFFLSGQEKNKEKRLKTHILKQIIQGVLLPLFSCFNHIRLCMVLQDISCGIAFQNQTACLGLSPSFITYWYWELRQIS